MQVAESSAQERKSAWPLPATAGLRAAFGILWAIAAFLTWRSAFAVNYVGYVQNASHGQPAWLQPWFTLWLSLITPAAGIFVWVTRIVETLIAIGLLFGLARKWIYIVGALFSLLIWSTAEGFGGP